MKWGYIVDDNGRVLSQLELSIKSHCHALITGSSGSGKSWTLLYLLGCLLQDTPEIEVYFCDFKNSEDFSFLRGYLHYYSGNECYEGVMEYYGSFCKARESGKSNKRHIIVVDEFPSFINYLTTKDKQEKTKKAGDIMGAIAELLMLGRGTCKGFGVWIVCQRPDSNIFSNGARDNFMVVLGLGKMSKEHKGMVFAGEEIPNRIFRVGEGCLLADGHPLYMVAYPRIKNMVDWKKHIKEILMRNSE